MHEILILTIGRDVLMEHLSRAVLQQRDLEIVGIHGGHAGFPYKRYLEIHPKAPYILVPALGWRKLFTLSISHC